jgi:hypothetical protein
MRTTDALTRTFHSDEEAEAWIAHIWTIIAGRQLPSPRVHVRRGSPLTITLEMPNLEAERLLVDELDPSSTD